MDIKRLYYTFKNKAWLLVLAMIVGLGIAAFLNEFLLVPTYRAECTLHIMNQQGAYPGSKLDYSDISLSRLLAQDYSTIAYSRRVTSKVISQLKLKGIHINEKDIRQIVDVSNRKDTNIISVSADWPDPKGAALISNTMSTVLRETINEVVGGSYVHFLDEANPPNAPVFSSTRILVVGVMAGFLIGVAVLYLFALFDTKIHSVEDIKSVDLEVIGIIPEYSIK